MKNEFPCAEVFDHEFNQNQMLTILAKSFLTKNHFQSGDLVRWKMGLKNKKLPEEDASAIVIEVLDQPVFDDEKNSGTTYFREPLDVVIALLDDDGDFLTFHVDGRRFEPVSPEAAEDVRRLM